MPRIIRSRFLFYRNPSRNSDKIFNIFLIEDDGCFSCITEHGRSGTTPVRVVVCANSTFEAAAAKFDRKLADKRNHRETPYIEQPREHWESPFSRESREPGSRVLPGAEPDNVIASPVKKVTDGRTGSAQKGLLNQDQFDSLEI